MQIIIDYESSWRNSFLDGSNNEALPKNGRKFIASMTELKKDGNFKQHQITKDTVMGILNRLIGDQRKLYQARSDQNYYFKNIEATLKDSDIKDQIYSSEEEMIFLRNISGSTDQNAFTGMIKAKDAAFNSEFSQQLWGVLFLSLENVVRFILDNHLDLNSVPMNLDPIIVINQLEELNGIKTIELEGDNERAYHKVQSIFPDVDFKLSTKGLFTPVSFYTAALYIQLAYLNQKYDLSEVMT
ncbi:type I-Fv CRISPR-associated protein Cas5fv, partial [Wohlfahrtiimonas larvae]